jgi:heterodisulfide reductase subunit A-like polyferredoxin
MGYHGNLKMKCALAILALIASSIMPTVAKTSNLRVPFIKPSSKQNMINDVDVLVVGAGLSGSVASFYLNKKSINTLLVEENDVVGGCLVSKEGALFNMTH